MRNIVVFISVFTICTYFSNAQTTVDCNVGPVNEIFCYDSGVTEEFTYISSDGSSLNLTINSGNVENNWDEFIVLDTDGTELYNGYGNAGNLAGLTFQSTGDQLTVQVTADGSISCQESDNINPIDLSVSCATCTNPQVNFELVDDCLNAPQFFVEVDVIDLGSATDLDITDNQGNPAQTTATTEGVLSFGPYPNGTLVELNVQNNQDANCQIGSGVFTQDNCTLNQVDCVAGPVNSNFCYDSGVTTEFTYVSNDGSPLNLAVNSGNVENNWDEFIVLDTDGTVLYNGYGNAGDLTGLTFQSTGDELTIQVVADAIISCQNSDDINPIDLSVSCATCVNPQVNFELVNDCLNAPQFFVEADVINLGSATDLDITDNQGNPPQTTATTEGVLSFGPYPNGTLVELSVQNNQDENCQIDSGVITQDTCTLNLVDCEVGPVNTNFCYDSGVTTEFTYVSNDGTPLNLVVNSGSVENIFDEFIVLDTDGTELYNGYGDGGNIAGLTFQSTGDELTVQVAADGSISCQSSENISPIDLSVSCATCVNPQVNFELVDDCLNAPQFFVEADVINLGSATDLDITDNQGNPPQTTATTEGVLSFGPYPNGTLVELSVQNNQDANCQIGSGVITQDTCTLNLVDCEVGPVNTNFCYDSGVTTEFTYVSNDGTPLNLVVNSGSVENIFDEFIVLDTDGTELYNGYGDGGNLAGLAFQSTGDEITVQVAADGSVGCQSSNNINPIDLTVSCATCINPNVNYFVVGDCENENEEFSVDVEISDLGSATALDITNNQDDAPVNVTSPTTLTFGPYALGTNVVFTVENVDDSNCTLTSPNQTLISCGCFGADPFCAPEEGESLIFENVSNGSSAPEGIDYDCLGSQPDPVWFFLQIEEGGDLDFKIVQNTQFDEQGNPIGQELDVDFIAWGPFENTLDACNDLSINTQIGCSFSPDPEENFSISNAQNGEIYIVLITNFNGAPGFISLGQTNIEDPGSGSTDCDIVLKNQVTACPNEETILTASDMAAEQYQWLLFNEDTEEFDPIQGENTPSLSVNESGLYQILSLTGTEINTEEFEVAFIPEPEHNMPEQVTLCSDESEVLDASVLNSSEFDSIEYQWYLNDAPIDGGTSATHEATGPGMHSVEITTTSLNIDTSGNDKICVSQVDVQVDLTDFTVNLGEDQTFCDEGSQTITASISGSEASDVLYEWNTGETTPSIEVDTTGVYEVTVIIGDCLETASVEYIFNESPVIALGPDSQTCDLAEFILNATPTNIPGDNVNYNWSLNGIDIEQNTASINPAEFGYGVYEVNVYFDDPNCSTTDSIELSLRDDVTVSITSDDEDNLFCPDESITFTANIENANIAEIDFEWFVNGEPQNVNNQVLENFELEGIGSTVDVSVEARIGQECLFTNSLNISFYDLDSCVISQGLSPNGDGFNDNLDLRFLDDRSGISTFEIFNRYGQKVYEKANYRDEFIGQSDTGNNLSTGTYFYVIKFEQEDEVYGILKKGWIYINREQ